ncbi:MAG: histidine phosphatase family protein [Spirochaetia bacterium]|nr:histidine phosphatase family protein [Spirochaetia bacterium]
MNIYVTRHGETEWNTYWKLQGRSNTVLNEKGREQACLTHNGFVGAGISFDRIYSSPLKRAVETAVLMTEKSESEIIKDDRLIEFSFGKAEGKTPDERNEDPELKDFHFFFDEPEKYVALEGAESFESVLKRTAAFWEDEIKPLEKTGIQNILVVTHGGTMQSLLLHIDGRSLKDYWKTKMANCTINKIVLENGCFRLEYTGKVFYREDKSKKSADGFFSNH